MAEACDVHFQSRMLAQFWQTLKRLPAHVSRGGGTRNAQEKIDTENLHQALTFWKRYVELKHREPSTSLSTLTSADFDKLFDTKTFEKSYFDLRADNADVLDYQLFTMFEHARKSGGINAYPKPVYKPNEKRPVVTETEAYLSERVPVSDIELFNPGDMIEHPGGFHLQVRKSRIEHPESGYGVFVAKGEILPGTVVALYPGTVYFHKDLNQSVINHNEYMISRYDDAIIDGRSWDRKNEIATRDSLQLQHIQIRTKNLDKFRNPYGIGQYINHPAPGDAPNVMAYSYDFPNEFPEELQSFIPNDYHTPPSGIHKRPGTVMHSMLLVASKRILEHEEILLNYRYNPSNPYPDWYAQPDPEEAMRRWGQVKLL